MGILHWSRGWSGSDHLAIMHWSHDCARLIMCISYTGHMTHHALITWLIIHWSGGYHALITWLIIHWSRSYHALITWLSCTEYVADLTLITWLHMHLSRGWSYSDPVADHTLITWLIMDRSRSIMHWSHDYQALIPWLIMHWSRDCTCTSHVTI